MDINASTESLISSIRTPWGDIFFHSIALLTSEYIFFSLIFFLTILAFKYRRIRALTEFELAAIISTAVTTLILKYTLLVSRPISIAIALGTEHTPSFPSLHAAMITALVGSLYITVYPRLRTSMQKNIFIILSLSAWAIVLISRLYLRVHYMTDIIAGCAVGFLCILLCRYMMRK